jgi:multidrug efflux pump subunit AcrB
VRRIPLDALPDISDVQVIIHTAWNGEPPNIIEDQVTYPIVTALLAAPHVKAVRAQTMFGDSYVFVVFERKVVASRPLSNASSIMTCSRRDITIRPKATIFLSRIAAKASCPTLSVGAM